MPPRATAKRLDPPAMMDPFTEPAVDSATPRASTRGSTALRHPDPNHGDAADTACRTHRQTQTDRQTQTRYSQVGAKSGQVRVY